MRRLVAEDVVTRGGRVQETIQIVRDHGGIVVAAGSIVDRSGGEIPDFGCPFVSLVQMNVETFAADNIPADLQGIPAIKPDNNPPYGRRDDDFRIIRTKLFCEHSTHARSDGSILQKQCALEKLATMKAAAKDKVTVEQGSGLFEKVEDVLHRILALGRPVTSGLYPPTQ